MLDEQGNPAAPPPRVRSDLRQEISPEHIELVRKGLWKVVNEDGGTGGRARLKDWVVAGKTGTAQATDRGQEENVAWFACFAPYDHPKYVVAVMVQGASGHGGEVAGPIADRILERSLALDEGKFDMPVAWLSPAHHANPLQLIKSVAYNEKGGNLAGGGRRRCGPIANCHCADGKLRRIAGCRAGSGFSRQSASAGPCGGPRCSRCDASSP